MRLRSVGHALALLWVLCSPAPAEARRVKVLRKLSLAQQTASPSFSAAAELRIVDRDRWVYIGSGIMAEQQDLYLLRLSDRRRARVRVPLDELLRRNPGMKLVPEDRRPVHEQFWILRLLFIDSENREAGVEVVDRFGTDRVRRHFFIHWDLRRRRLTRATLVARERPGMSHAESLALGYDPARREFYYARQVYERTERSRTVTVVGFIDGKHRIVTRLASERPMQRQTYFDPPRHRVLMVEYAELADQDQRPQGYLVDLARGKVREMRVPLTTYGVAFGPGGDRIYTYSSQLGELWAIDANTGQRVQRLGLGKVGHALGLFDSKSLLLLRNSGFRFVRLGEKMSPGPFIPISELYKGFSNVDGSVVIPGGALVRNGDELYVVQLDAKEPEPRR